MSILDHSVCVRFFKRFVTLFLDVFPLPALNANMGSTTQECLAFVWDLRTSGEPT